MYQHTSEPRWTKSTFCGSNPSTCVEVAVVEAGLGGRYDATSVLDAPVTVLTNVGLEHTRWLGPTVESTLDRYAAEGVREVVLHPIGFVCDHVEVLYDIDIGFHEYAAGRGIKLGRPESLNGSLTFTRALGEVVKRCL